MKKASTKKVLVIDDEQSILDTMRIVLETEGFNAVLRSTPPTVEKIIKIDPDIILLDLLLRDANGKDICINLKKNNRVKTIPIIMFSAHSKDMLEEAVNECGADGFVTKPFDIDLLSAMLRKYAK